MGGENSLIVMVALLVVSHLDLGSFSSLVGSLLKSVPGVVHSEADHVLECPRARINFRSYLKNNNKTVALGHLNNILHYLQVFSVQSTYSTVS